MRARERQVIVGGDSAGGNLTAALCMRLKRLNGPMPLGQVLIYPGLGGDLFRNGERNLDAPLLPVRDSGGYRGIYAGGESRIPQNDPEFAPLCAPDLRGLPPAAIFAAGIDPLRQDAEDYAALLAASGIATMFRNEVGLVHGYLRARHMSRAAARSFAAIAEALSRMASGAFRRRLRRSVTGVAIINGPATSGSNVCFPHWPCESCHSGIVKSFGRRLAYESLRGTNPRTADDCLWVFRFLAEPGEATTGSGRRGT